MIGENLGLYYYETTSLNYLKKAGGTDLKKKYFDESYAVFEEFQSRK